MTNELTLLGTATWDPHDAEGKPAQRSNSKKSNLWLKESEQWGQRRWGEGAEDWKEHQEGASGVLLMT